MNIKRIVDALGTRGAVGQYLPGQKNAHPVIDAGPIDLEVEYLNHLAAIVETSEDSIISKSLDGTIKSWNRGSEKMFGYKAEEMIGKNISLLIPDEYIEQEKDILRRVSKNEFVQPYETVRIKKDGGRLFVSLTVSPLRDSTGNIIGASKIGHDITSRKNFETALINTNRELAFQNEEKEKRAAELAVANRELAFQIEEKEKRAAELIIINSELSAAESRLKEVNHELEAFTYSVSHDLRAPLRAVNSYAQILREDYGPGIGEDGMRILESICYNSKKMGALIDELLSFSKLGRKDIERVEIDLNELLRGIVEDSNRTSGSHAEIHIGSLPVVKGDYALLRQAFVNLLSNAVKYSSKKEQPLISITAGEKKGKTVFSIKDNGVGFDMQFIDKLFGVFQRLHSEKEFEGNGVGLAIVQRIIAKHGGRVWAEAKQNEGAVFYFTLN